MRAQQPQVFVVNENTQRETGRSAQLSNIAAARAISSVVRTTLGVFGFTGRRTMCYSFSQLTLVFSLNRPSIYVEDAFGSYGWYCKFISGLDHA